MDRDRRAQEGPVLNVEFHVASFASMSAMGRGAFDKRLIEVALSIQKALEPLLVQRLFIDEL